MCGMTGKMAVLLCQQIAQLEHELEQEVGTLTASSLSYLRGMLVQRGDVRAVGVFDSVTRKPEQCDYDLSELKA